MKNRASGITTGIAAFILLPLVSVLVPATGLPQAVSPESRLADTLSRLEDSTASLVNEWDDTARACDAVYHSVFGNMKAPCRKIRAALRRGTLARFQLDCFKRGADSVMQMHELKAYTDTPDDLPAGLESALFQFQRGLQKLCSLEQAKADYPHFTALLEEARRTPIGNDFAGFGPVDSMAWWSFDNDPASNGSSLSGSGFGAPGGSPNLPVIGGR